MKILLRQKILFSLTLLSTLIAVENSFASYWVCELQNIPTYLTISKSFEQTVVSIESSDPTVPTILAENVKFKNEKLHFELKDIKGTFDGQLQRDESQIIGIWKQDNKSSKFVLKKIEKIPELVNSTEPKNLEGIKSFVDKLVVPIIQGRWIRAIIVGIEYKGQTQVWGYGNTSLKNASRIPDGKTEFEIGSLTKLFTKLMLIDMVQKNKIDLDLPAQKYFSQNIILPSKYNMQITPLELAEHTSGLPRDPDDIDSSENDDSPYGNYSIQKLSNYLKRCNLYFAPGKQYLYSNTGVALLGDLITNKSGLSYEEYLKKIVCEPLGLLDTSVFWTPSQLERAEQGYDSNDEPTKLWEWKEKTFIPAGAIHSTADDMLKLASSLFNQNSNIQKLTSNKMAEELGWNPIIEHDGQTFGFNSAFFVSKPKKNAFIIWGNCGDLKISQLAIEVKRLLNGHKPVPLDLPTIIPLTELRLKPFLGSYIVEKPDEAFNILKGYRENMFCENGHLAAVEEENNSKEFLYPMQNGIFYSKSMSYPISFVFNTSGEVIGAEVLQNILGIKYSLRKLNQSGKPMEGNIP